jgi:hypothetical protein
MNEIILYKSPLKALRLIALSSLFVLPSIYFILTKDNPEPIFWICICFFGLGYIVGFINILDQRPQIILNSKGIWDRRFKIEVIPWDDIFDAYLFSIHKQYFIALVINEKIASKVKAPKWIENFNYEIGAQKINLNVGDIKVNRDKFVTAIIQLTKEQPENRAAIISKLNLK